MSSTSPYLIRMAAAAAVFFLVLAVVESVTQGRVDRIVAQSESQTDGHSRSESALDVENAVLQGLIASASAPVAASVVAVLLLVRAGLRTYSVFFPIVTSLMVAWILAGGLRLAVNAYESSVMTGQFISAWSPQAVFAFLLHWSPLIIVAVAWVFAATWTLAAADKRGTSVHPSPKE